MLELESAAILALQMLSNLNNSTAQSCIGQGEKTGNFHVFMQSGAHCTETILRGLI